MARLLIFFAASRFARATVVQDGLIFEYLFPRAECVEGGFADTSNAAAADGGVFGALRRDPESTWCLDGQGIGGSVGDSSIYATSERNASAIKAVMAAAQAKGDDGLSIELWLWSRNPGDSVNREPILSIAAPSTNEWTCDGPVTTAITVAERDGFLAVYMGYREKVITLGCMDWNCCLQVPIRTALLPKNEPTHAVIVIGHHMDVYINGEVLWNGTNVPYMKLFDWSNFDFENAWDDSFRLELFSDGLARNMKNYAFDGGILAARMYSRQLSGAEAKQNYAARLPNSPPYAFDCAVAVYEDGEDIAGGQLVATAYLSALQPELLVTVALGIVDADDELLAPNYQAYHADPSIDTFAIAYLSSLPSVGEVLLRDGTVLTDADLPARVARDATGNYTVLVRPPRNAYSGDGSSFAMLNFSYYAIDGIDGSISDVATMTIVVLAVNDPPVPFYNISALADADAAVIIALGGTDVDDSTVGIVASVATAPRWGNATLWQVNATTGDVSTTKVVPGDALWSLAVAYTFDGAVTPATMNADTGVFLNDTFGFALTDVHGATSSVANVTVGVRTPLRATPSTKTPAVYEEAYGGAAANEISLQGSDVSDAALDVCVAIVSLPAHGMLYDPASTTPAVPLVIGDVLATRLASPYASGAPVTFAGDVDWFNLPDEDWTGDAVGLSADAIGYTVLSCDARNRVSTSAWQLVDVRNVNDAPMIAATTTNFEVYAIGFAGSDYDDEKYAESVTLRGLTLGDVDRDVDAVRVSLKADSGMLSLSGDLNLADFDSSDYCYDGTGGKKWYCCCNGLREDSMTFVATPADAATLLAELLYESYKPNTVDTVTIWVYDGVGGDCLATHASVSIWDDTCFSSNVSVTVEVGEYANLAADIDSSSDGMAWQLAVGLGAGIVVLMCTCCVCAYRKFAVARRPVRGMPTLRTSLGWD